MTDHPDIYRAPQADLEKHPAGEDGAGNFRFYVVSTRKFLILFFGTFSLYTIYWFYQNFKLNKRFLGNNDWPVPRAIFSIFFVHGLFEMIDHHIKRKDREHGWNPRQLATAYVVMMVLGRVMERFSAKSEDFTAGDALGLLLTLSSGMVLYFAQKAINVACLEPQDDPNDKLTIANWIWIGLGTILWVLVIIGLGMEVLGIKA